MKKKKKTCCFMLFLLHSKNTLIHANSTPKNSSMIDSSKKQPDNRIHLFDPVGLITDSYERPASRRAIRSHDGFAGAISGGSPLRFAVETDAAEGGDSGASSPPLWKSPAESPALDSRTQAIARGRREMMEMIKDMPESTYELSLRDIVDQKSPSPEAPPPDDPKSKSEPRRKAAISRSESKKKVARSRSIDNGGFLLKTSVFPISFWLKKKSKKNLGSKRKSGVSSESEIGGISRSHGSSCGSSSSSRSSSTSSRQAQSNRFLPDCLSFKAKK